MQKLLGLVLLMSGLAMSWLWLPAREGNPQLAEVIAIEGSIARVGHPDAPEPSSQSPAPSRPAVAARPSSATPMPDARQAAPARGVQSAGTARTGAQAHVPSQIAVTNASVVSPTPEPPLGSPQPATEDAYYALVRDLQRELRRLGCYWGEIDGSWGPGAKRGMSALMGRVNATLPVNEPDYILLALARSQPDQACRKPCPPEQLLMSDTGQCQPRALVRHAAGGHAEGTDTAPTALDTSAGAPYAPLPGQMAIGGPRPEAEGGPDAGAAVQRPRPPPTWYRQPRRDNSWKKRVFGDLY
jgi:hypothetical protein